MTDNRRLTAYLHQRAIGYPWSLPGEPGSGFSGAVVIPALAESEKLPATVESLSHNHPEIIRKFLVIVVVNHRVDAPPQDKADNRATLALLPGLADRLPLNLAWIDAASPGFELPLRDGGVGMARKLGFDLVLPRLDWQSETPVLVALDADTLVEPGYLQSIITHFKQSADGGAVIPFRHQYSTTPEEQGIIDRYELFLRSYVLGLAYAGSPYAFHTVGSAMACTADAYLRCGGMNSRRAGEDFYFLQQLKKVAGVQQVRGTVVHPSPRPSHRVPFGTGRSVSTALAGDGCITFYRHECFADLREWLTSAMEDINLSGGSILTTAERISPLLRDYLVQERFPDSWDRISRMKRTDDALRAAFHEWFDALRTMKLIHYMSAESYPRCSPEDAVTPLLKLAGLEPVPGVKAQLELLRGVQS